LLLLSLPRGTRFPPRHVPARRVCEPVHQVESIRRAGIMLKSTTTQSTWRRTFIAPTFVFWPALHWAIFNIITITCKNVSRKRKQQHQNNYPYANHLDASQRIFHGATFARYNRQDWLISAQVLSLQRPLKIIISFDTPSILSISTS